MSDNGEHSTILGPDCKSSGHMSINGDSTIMGEHEGSIRAAGVLYLAETSHVSGTVIASTVRITGRVDDDVIAEHKVELIAGCVVTGRIYAADAMNAAAELIQQAAADQPDMPPAPGSTTGEAGDLQVQTTPAAANPVRRYRRRTTTA